MNFDYTFILIITLLLSLYLIKGNLLVHHFRMIESEAHNVSLNFLSCFSLNSLLYILSIALLLVSLSSLDYGFRYSDFIVIAFLLSFSELFNVVDRSSASRDYHLVELETNLVRMLTVITMFVCFIFMNKIINIKDFVNYQNSTRFNIPAWNIFWAFPLTFTFVSNYLLNADDIIKKQRIHNALCLLKYTLRLLSFILSFVVLFLGGFYGFGNLDVLISNNAVLTVVLYTLAVLKIVCLIYFINYIERLTHKKNIFEVRALSYRNLKINLVCLILILIYRIAI